jgi:Phage derived protein Gp49-like (DUF891)
MRSGVAGIGTSVTPREESASRIAFITVGVAATVPPSPTPLAPIARALYATATGRRVVILRVFTKKTQRPPRREIGLARRRAEEVT